jgi:hypothetical protein
MGLIKEPIGVDFTVESTAWTAEEEKEFRELIRKQREAYRKKQVQLPTSLHFIASRRRSLSSAKIYS